MIEPKTTVTFTVRVPIIPVLILETDNIPITRRIFHPPRPSQYTAQSANDPESVSHNDGSFICIRNEVSPQSQSEVASLNARTFERREQDNAMIRPGHNEINATNKPESVSTGIRRPVVQSNPNLPACGVNPTQNTLIYPRFQRIIRSHKEYTNWYTSQGCHIDSPPESSSSYSHTLGVGDLFINQVGPRKFPRTWIWLGMNWSLIHEGDAHPAPDLDDYCLHFLQSGEPAWITRKSKVTYQSRLKKITSKNKD
ncbi:hypothetical protein BJ138DRAFT_1158508 [Hygrophoropsis aurantiaca]|uniref:Uncharacterized protein n=1 Tax=Hygrophoropsis aurantiaca TaxID=72124 RepID=A0ACB8A3S6_9AGAM|nr:hypothetical protein BJ138DRAFT_1158508 [Hygrophoropsis aurantiaca]